MGVVGPGRLGVRLSPVGRDPESGAYSQRYFDCIDTEPEPLYAAAIAGLDTYPLAYLCLTEPRSGAVSCGSTGPTAADDLTAFAPLMAARYRRLYRGTLIGAGSFTPQTAAEAIANGHYDMIAFGRWFISNPDLPIKIQRGAPLNVYDTTTFYEGGLRGYIDYNTLDNSILDAAEVPTVEQRHIGRSPEEILEIEENIAAAIRAMEAAKLAEEARLRAEEEEAKRARAAAKRAALKAKFGGRSTR